MAEWKERIRKIIYIASVKSISNEINKQTDKQICDPLRSRTHERELQAMTSGRVERREEKHKGGVKQVTNGINKRADKQLNTE